MSASIITNKLTKRYSATSSPALDKLSIHIKAGEIYGFLGANGAGKSTTIRLLMNFLQPTSGSATISDLNIVRDSVAVKKHIGYLAGDIALYSRTTGRELLDYLATLQGGVDASYRRKLEKRFQAETDKPVSALSKGNRQKIGILQACMHQPEVLILDEPTSGLDPLMQEAFYETMREARARGAAVLMSSHNLAEAQILCDRVGIIKKGKLIREQAVSDNSVLSLPTFRVTLDNARDAAKLKTAAGLTYISQLDANTLILQSSAELKTALASLSTFDIRDLVTQQPSLEDEFIEFYGGQDA